MSKINLPERWKIAQASERRYWEGFTKETLIKEELERHQKKAAILEKEWASFMKLDKKMRILQIGCGPEDVITHLKIGKRYALDPLADFYKQYFKLDYKDLTFVAGRGENIPFPDEYFDIVIIANVLDHVEDPRKVLLEIKRVLKKDGFLHFENLFYQKNFLRIAKVWGFFKQRFTGEIFNINHPYMFGLDVIKKMLSREFRTIKSYTGREICYYENFKELRKVKLADKKLTVKLPAIFGLYGIINYIAICKKV